MGNAERTGQGMTTFGDRARELMTAQDVSLRELARRTFYDKAHLSRVLNGHKPANMELARALDDALQANGALRSIVAAQAVPGRVLTPDEADRIAYVAGSPRRVDQTALGSLTVVLAESRRLEDAVGPASLIEPVRGHLHLLERLTLDARGTIRPAVVDLAGQWSQYVGWLYAALGQLPASRRWFDRTLEWATEANNPTLIANALSFKGHLGWMQGYPGPTIGLSQAAQRDPAVHSSQRAFDALQEAKGHALAGAVTDADRKLGDAERLTAWFAEHPDEVAPWSYYYTPALFTLERALAHRHLGRQQIAADLLSAGLEALPSEHRGAEWTGDYRRALAEARRAL